MTSLLFWGKVLTLLKSEDEGSDNFDYGFLQAYPIRTEQEPAIAPPAQFHLSFASTCFQVHRFQEDFREYCSVDRSNSDPV